MKKKKKNCVRCFLGEQNVKISLPSIEATLRIEMKNFSN